MTTKRSAKTRLPGKTPARRLVSVESRRRDTHDPPSDRRPDKGDGFPVVGIGASAGGLDAFKKLLSAMPLDTGMAFVIIPHLDPTHESLMVELLARQTTMPVREARDGLLVEANHVYVIPPNADLTIEHRVLRVAPPPARRGSQTAIDVFLQSLAADQQTRAIGIILSGTGSHGSLGVTAIKAAGGLVLAQTPESAEHDQMPRNAISTGVVDLILPPEEMPKALVRHAAEPAAPRGDVVPGDLAQILLVLRTQTKRDFRGYRANILMRRVRRRMGSCHVERVAEYVQYLRAHPDEGQALAKDLSIGVTAFFREPEAFQVLERVVIPDLVQRSRRSDGERPVRVWVPGCATGEEAYSIAILFLEQFGVARQPVTLQVFATDVDEESLDVARAGLYPDSIAADLSAERLRHFFVRMGGHRYEVSRVLRETITFAPQNLISDAPFSKLDLISCRNVLIYLEPDVQAKIVAVFHFALNEGGYLILGPAESIGQATDRFEPISKKWRVYRRTGATRRDLVEIPILPTTAQRPRTPRHDERPRPPAAVAELLHRTLLTEFAPAAVLIDRRYQIRSVQGPVVDYLEFPPGELTRNVLSMARPGLRPAIRGVCEHALKSQRAAIDASARVKRQGTYVPCTVTARPVAGAGDTEGLLAVTFQDAAFRTKGAKPVARAAAHRRLDDATLVRHLEQELKATHDDLQGTIDELETTNEELKASHEEVLSMNEEFQSTNEELESSKEELQSLNEELSTVNSQLQNMVEQLPAGAVLREGDRLTMNRAAETITGYERSALPTVEAWCAALHGAQAHDRRSLYERSRSGQRDEQPVSLAITRKDGQARHLELTVCRLDDTRELWMLLDLTDQDQAERALRRSEDYLRSIVTTAATAIITIDERGTIDTFNAAAERMFGYTVAEVVGQNVRLLMPPPYHDEHDGYLARYLKTGEAHIIGVGREVVGLRKDGTTFPLDLAVSEIGHSRCFTGILRDLSDRRDLEWRLAESQIEERQHMARELHDDLGGHMTGVGLLAQTLHGELTKAGSPLAARTQELVQSIGDAQLHLRSVVRGLMPVEAIPEGLMAALGTLVKQSEAASAIACRFECEPPVHVEDSGTAVHLFRIAQEAVHNAVRHAEATQIVVSLKRKAQRLEIAVTDNGRGFGDIPDGHPGIGLAGMHQRARLLGGDCSIQPRDGGGTVVMCWVPSPEPVGRDTRMPLTPPGKGDGLIGLSKTTPTSTK